MADSYSYPGANPPPNGGVSPAPASPIHYAAAQPPQDSSSIAGQPQPGQPPQQPMPQMAMPGVPLQPAFPDQFLPMGTHQDAIRNMMAYRLAQQGHPAATPPQAIQPPLPPPLHPQGPTVDPRIRREMNAGHEGRG